MRWFTLFSLLVGFVTSTQAHHPDREHQHVHPRIDLIGPLGTNLPISHRRRYNRPTYIGGKIAYWIAPSSQEAMAWHDASHRCFYKNHRPRIEKHFFYPKPWEVLRVGPRQPTEPSDNPATESYPDEPTELESVENGPVSLDSDSEDQVSEESELELIPLLPMVADLGMIEE